MKIQTFDLYLDDSGIRYPDRKPPSSRSDGIDHFALGGLLIASEKLEVLIERYNQFANKYDIDYPLHSHKIRTKKEEFRWLANDDVKVQEFYRDLEDLLCQVPGHAIACCIDRPGYNLRYKEKYGSNRWQLCKSAYTIVVERAAKFSMRNDRKLIVYVEETGKYEDKSIKQYHRDMVGEGMYFDRERSSIYQPLQGEDFSKVLMKNPNFVKKQNKAMQIADLILYPIVKAGYDKQYKPYLLLKNAGKIINSALDECDHRMMGVKYYCFNEAGA